MENVVNYRSWMLGSLKPIADAPSATAGAAHPLVGIR